MSAQILNRNSTGVCTFAVKFSILSGIAEDITYSGRGRRGYVQAESVPSEIIKNSEIDNDKNK